MPSPCLPLSARAAKRPRAESRRRCGGTDGSSHRQPAHRLHQAGFSMSRFMPRCAATERANCAVPATAAAIRSSGPLCPCALRA